MANDIIPISNFAIGMNFNGEIIKKVRYDTNKRTGIDYIFVRTDTGNTYVMKQNSKGVKNDIHISIPDYDTKKEREEIIKELSSHGYKQVDIAFFMDISQSTVSKVLSKEKK